MTESESGKFAYESYCENVRKTPTWEQLGEIEKNGWISMYEEIKAKENTWYLEKILSLLTAMKENNENKSSPL
jgi:hypothetical protein